MLTVLIEVSNDDAGALAATLSRLVPAALDGFVREVVVLDAGIGPSARELAEDTGCSVCPVSRLSDVVAGARGQWLLLIEPGSLLEPGWMEEVDRRAREADAGERGAYFRRRGWAPSTWFSVGRFKRLAHGLLARRDLLSRSFTIGMRLTDLAAAVPARPMEGYLVSAKRGD